VHKLTDLLENNLLENKLLENNLLENNHNNHQKLIMDFVPEK
jgi:hypothetical protein